MRIFTVGANDAGRRVDAFLKHLMPTLPSGMLYKYIRTNKIKLNGKKPKADSRVIAGDTVTYFGADEFLPQIADVALLSEKAGGIIPHVVYEDKNIVLLYKGRGVACQPDKTRPKKTLADMLKWYLYQNGSFDPATENTFSPALCNRLDVNTTGLVIGAKNMEALRAMNEKIRTGEVRKFYRCRVLGMPNPPEGIVETKLKKDEKQNISRVSETGKTAITRYRTFETNGETSTLEIELITGRSHQIRVHMRHIGCPLVGDPKYGEGGKGQDLCAYRIFFDFQSEDGVLGYLKGKSFALEPKLLFE